MRFSTDLEFAFSMDDADPLATFRDCFHIPKHQQLDSVYLCGNSLGLMPKKAGELIGQELDDWAKLAVEGHFHGERPWVEFHDNLTQQTARLVGAKPHEVVCMNSLTVNLHLMLVSFYRPDGPRNKILIEKPAFPSDRYALVSQLHWHGLNPDDHLLELGPNEGEHFIRYENLERTLQKHGSEIALVLWPGVQYYSGQSFDLQRVSELAGSHGCRIGFDLAHAVGNVPMSLHDSGADFAVWCTYKYLNAGPGAVAGCFVHEKNLTQDLPRLAGWWGHNKSSRFQMGPDFDPIATAEGWQLSNPPVLSMTPLIASMELFDQAGMTALRQKSEVLTGYLEFLIYELLATKLDILTPADASQRGCQLSIQVKSGQGRTVFEGLQKNHVICDWREPDVIRLAPAPMYNSFADVHRCVMILKQLL